MSKPGPERQAADWRRCCRIDLPDRKDRARLGGRAVLAIMAGGGAPCPARKGKSRRPVSQAGFEPPAASPTLARAVESQSGATTMHRPKRQVADRGNAPEFIATRLCHYEQIDGIARLVFSTPSLKLPGDPPGVDDVITLVLIMPISEQIGRAHV